MTEEETILGVPIGKIVSRRNLLGTWRHFGKEYERPCHNRQQFDALGVPDLKIAAYILDCESRKRRDTAIKAADEAMSKQTEEDWVADRKERERLSAEEHEKKYREYLEDISAPIQADRDAVRALAGIALAIEKNQAAQYAYMDRIDPASMMNKKILSDEVARLSTEFRQLQKMLGIDMPTRIKAEQQATGIDVVRDIVEGTRSHFDTYNVPVEHCNIEIGDWQHYFPEVGYMCQTICPRCGEPVHIHKEFSLTMCPICEVELIRDELGVIRCPECGWKTTIHDAT